jgi:hypothetical protein
VVLPAPLGPSRPRTVPRVTSRLTPARAFTSPNVLTRPRTVIAAAGTSEEQRERKPAPTFKQPTGACVGAACGHGAYAWYESVRPRSHRPRLDPRGSRRRARARGAGGNKRSRAGCRFPAEPPDGEPQADPGQTCSREPPVARPNGNGSIKLRTLQSHEPFSIGRAQASFDQHHRPAPTGVGRLVAHRQTGTARASPGGVPLRRGRRRTPGPARGVARAAALHSGAAVRRDT